MKRPNKIDFFDLSDSILERLNSEGGTKITHYDISLKLSRDINYPSDKFNISLYVFEERSSFTYYTVDYSSIEKIVSVLFLHAKDDMGFVDTRHGLITTKRISLESKLRKTIKKIKKVLVKKFKNQNLSDLVVFVDEIFPCDNLDLRGLPFYELNIYSKNLCIDIKISLEFNSTDFSDGEKILKEVDKKINSI